MTIVLCSKGYPGKYKKNLKIKNINKIKIIKKRFYLSCWNKNFKIMN